MFDLQPRQILTLRSSVREDAITEAVKGAFDYSFTGDVVTEIQVPEFPEDFQIGLIVGSSGSGKSTLIKTCFGQEDIVTWDNGAAVVSNFASAKDGIDKLCAVGFGSIPSWCKPYSVLSTGEKFRADLARRLHDQTVIDEFTSVVNREVAKSCSCSVAKYIRNNGLKRVVFASCHDDIIPYLQPDWVYSTDTRQLYNGRYLQRTPIEIVLFRCTTREWEMFKKHHYLSGAINKSSNCYLATINEYPVAFVASIAFPFGGVKHAWREHRLVVLPDYQGIGIGNSVSETVAQHYVEMGCRYFSKTANPRCGIHRDKSSLWRQTSHNHKNRPDYIKDGKARGTSRQSMSVEQQFIHSNRICYSHEYIGDGMTYPYTYKAFRYKEGQQ